MILSLCHELLKVICVDDGLLITVIINFNHLFMINVSS